MSEALRGGGDVLRGALVRIDADQVLAAVDRLNLKPGARVSPVVGFPLRTLQQRRDVVAFATSAPHAAVAALVELLAAGPLEKVVGALGAAAESPTYDELARALDEVVAGGVTDDEVVAVLAHAVGEGFPAAPHCRRLLEERPQWALPVVEVAPPATPLVTRERDEAVRAQRRARRAERKKAPGAVARPVHRPRGPKSSGVPRERLERAAIVSNPPDAPPVRRRIALTPAEAARFDPDHPLAGSVVLVEFPFEVADPGAPEQRSKERPALVVAASATEVLVRGIFSNPATTRSLFQPWRRVGLDHPSYIAVDRVALAAVDPSSLKKLGRIGDEEWNSTL